MYILQAPLGHFKLDSKRCLLRSLQQLMPMARKDVVALKSATSFHRTHTHESALLQ